MLVVLISKTFPIQNHVSLHSRGITRQVQLVETTKVRAKIPLTAVPRIYFRLQVPGVLPGNYLLLLSAVPQLPHEGRDAPRSAAQQKLQLRAWPVSVL